MIRVCGVVGARHASPSPLATFRATDYGRTLFVVARRGGVSSGVCIPLRLGRGMLRPYGMPLRADYKRGHWVVLG